MLEHREARLVVDFTGSRMPATRPIRPQETITPPDDNIETDDDSPDRAALRVNQKRFEITTNRG